MQMTEFVMDTCLLKIVKACEDQRIPSRCGTANR